MELTKYGFDAANRQTKVTTGYTKPEASITTASYDGGGRVTETVDGASNKTDSTYDAGGKVLTQKVFNSAAAGGAQVSAVTQAYDLAGELTRVRDGAPAT